MPERIIEGVKVKETGRKQWQYDYGPGDLAVVYNRGDWRSWNDMINWLEQEGETDNELTPGETIALVEDLRGVRDENAAFTEDYQQAFRLLHDRRGENNRRFADQHRRNQQR